MLNMRMTIIMMTITTITKMRKTISETRLKKRMTNRGYYKDTSIYSFNAKSGGLLG